MDGHCVTCKKISNKTYNETYEKKKVSPEKKREANQRWQKAHPESGRERNKRWRLANPEREREKDRRYKKEHPEIRLIQYHRRRTQERGNGGKYTVAEWKQLCNHYGNKCLRCGRSDVKLTADHVVPVALGGTSNIDNLQPLCLPCNLWKGARHMDFRNKGSIAKWIQGSLFE